MLEVLREFVRFARRRKKLILFPLVLILLILGTFLILAQTSALAPFIYTLF